MKKRIDKLIILGLTVLMVAALLVGGIGGCAKAPTPEISEWELAQIGILSGPAAAFGLDAAWGAKRAVDEINAAGGIRGVPIKLTQYDTAYDTAKATTIMASLVETALVIQGPMDQTGIEACGHLCVEEGVPFLSSVTSPTVRDKFTPWGSSLYCDTPPVVPAAVREWVKLEPDIKKIVLFYLPWEASHVDQIDYIEAAIANGELDVEIVGKVEVTVGQLDFGPTAIKAIGMNADGYYSHLNVLEHSKLARALNERGVEGRRICAGMGASGADLYALGKGYLEDTYIWDNFIVGYEGENWQALLKDYEPEHDGGQPWGSLVPCHYDSFYTIKAAFEACEITGEPDKLAEERLELRDWIYNAKGLDGIQGKFDYANGERVGPAYLMQIHDNFPEVIKTFTP